MSVRAQPAWRHIIVVIMKHVPANPPTSISNSAKTMIKEHKLLTCVRRGRTLRFKGAQSFRERLVYATLSSRPIQINDIRSMDESPGIRGEIILYIYCI